MSLSPQLESLKLEAMQTSCEAWAMRRRWVLARGIDRAGPCPKCGGDDRFAIHTKKNTFNCRGCGIHGAGVIDLVMQTEGLEFVKACEVITGRTAEAPVDLARSAHLAREAAHEKAERAQQEQRYRDAARKSAYNIWSKQAFRAPREGFVAQYFDRRGISFARVVELVEETGAVLQLREIERQPWLEKRGDIWSTLHEGPVMVACVQRPDGTFGAVHQTWLDLTQPKGKLVLPPIEEAGADGVIKQVDRPTKKVLGVKKGGAIRLFTPREARRLVVGEGIETTATALVHAFEPGTAYWAAVDLGNMAGKCARDANGHRIEDQPDMTDEDCFVPPDWCEEAIYLCDDDDARNHTEEKVVRGLKRALLQREAARAKDLSLPALTVSYVPPLGGGMDLNDLVRVG
jgi:hypothetical protein